MRKILKNLSNRIAIIVTILLIAGIFIPIMEVNAENEIVIDFATVTVTEPVAGEAPSYNVTVGDSSKYWIDDSYITWNKIYPTSGSVTTFEAGCKYDFRVLFRPKTGYTFSSDTIFLINGHKTGKWGDSNAMASYYFSTVDNDSTITVLIHMEDDVTPTSSTTITKGSTVPKPENPERNGYTFVRWETAQGYIYDFNEPRFSSPTELYARWVENANLQTNTITLNPNNETEETDSITNIVNQSIVNLGTLESYGFTVPEKEFYGWKIGNKVYLPGEDFEVTSDVTAVAQYIGTTVLSAYKVSFNANGGSDTMDDVTGLTGTYTLPENGFTAPANKQFKGWSLTSDGAIITTVEMTEDKTVYAIWEDIPLTQINELSATVTAPVGGEHPSFTATSGNAGAYTAEVVAWYDLDAGIEINASDYFVAGTEYRVRVHFTANAGYEIENPSTFTINETLNAMAFDTFTQRGMDFIATSAPATQITSASATVTIPVGGATPDFNPVVPDGANYTITVDTWYLHEEPYPDLTNESGYVEGKEYSLRVHFIANSGYEFANDATFTMNGEEIAKYGATGDREYSKVAIAPTSYNVTFELNGGTWTDSGTNPQAVNAGGKVTRPTSDPTKTNNLFVNWYADAGFTTPFNFDETTISGATTIYAKWSEYAQFGIGITPNAGSWDWTVSPGSTGAMNSMVLLSTIENHQVTFSATANSGYHFVGWYEGVMNNETHFVDSHTDTLLSADSTYVVTVTEYKTYIMAVFEADTPTDTSRVQVINSIDYNGLGTYTITGGTFDGLTSFSTTKAEFFEKGIEITLKATADSTYTFKGWYNAEEYDITGDKNLGVMSWRTVGDVLTTNSTYTFNVTNDYYNVMPVFEPKAGHNNIWTTSGGQIAVLYENRAEEQTILDGNHWKDAGIVVDYWKNDEITVKAKALEGYHFVGWFQTDPLASVPENYVKEPVISTSEDYTYKPGITTVTGINEPINYITAVFEANSNQKQVEYTLTDGNAEVKFTYEEGHEFTLVFKDIMKFTDEELSALGMTRAKFNELLETIKDNTKDDGEFVSVFVIEINEGEHGYTNAVKVKYKLTEEMKKYKSFKFIYLDDENNFAVADIANFTIDGDYMTGTLPHLSAYALVGSEEEVTIPGTTVDNASNPQTNDNIMTYVYILISSVACLAGGIIYLNRKKLFGNK